VGTRLRCTLPLAALRGTRFLAYLLDMWLRHNLKVSLRRNSLCSFSRCSVDQRLGWRLLPV